ncbi:MAG: hypothetical protein LC792_29050 [Actinobacteria bacterium]|nr:hypothetical protein [Actinomycetota bacterium]
MGAEPEHCGRVALCGAHRTFRDAGGGRAEFLASRTFERPELPEPAPHRRTRRPRSPLPWRTPIPHFLSARRALCALAASTAVVVPAVGALTPTAAWADTPNAAACSGLYHGNPPGSLAVTTSPAGGAVLHPGDSVDVTATWNASDWPKPVLHKVLDCLMVDGKIDYGHSSQEKPTDNDGLYRYRFTVPVGARRQVCDRVRLSGRLVDGGDLVVQKSNTVCFSVAGVANAPGTAVQGTTQAATPPAGGVPAPLQPAGSPADGASAPAESAAPAPASTPPAVEISPAVLSRPTLPRTGADVLPLVRLGTLLIVAGGAALAFRAALSRREPGLV